MAIIPLLTVEARIKRKLRLHLRQLGFIHAKNGTLTPPSNSKDAFRSLHCMQRQEKLEQERSFFDQYAGTLLNHFADGAEIDPAKIQPILLEVKAHTHESNLFRFASLTWSVPVSNGYGRRMRFLVWDTGHNRLMGIMALGDPVYNLRVRDQLIGWTGNDRRHRLVNMMDAYVLGAVPPYNSLLCGKLIACLVRTQEVKDVFSKRYRDKCGIISCENKKARLVAVTTSSALGRSSVYNRLVLGGEKYFTSIGYTSGWGHFHIPDDLFNEMRVYLKRAKHPYANNHKFGSGPNWRLRTIRAVLNRLGMNSDLLQHGLLREVFFCKLANNAERVLRGQVKRPNFSGLLTVDEVAQLAKARWILPRAERIPDYRSWKREGILQKIESAVDANIELEHLGYPNAIASS